MKIKDIFELAIKSKDYNHFLEQIKKLHGYSKDITINQIERQINIALGNKIPVSDYQD